jgi:hypothetical protein
MNSEYLDNKKLIADNLERLDIIDFNRFGLLNGYSNAKKTLRDGWEMQLDAYPSRFGGELYLSFPAIDNGEPFLKVDFDITRCRLGGHRYWFLCPKCRKRIGVLYGLDYNTWGCRHCFDLTYRSRVVSSREKLIILNYQKALLKVTELKKKIKKRKYLGNPTKSFKRLEKWEKRYARIGISIIIILEGLIKGKDPFDGQINIEDLKRKLDSIQ